jgi:hypothetical protein
MSSVSALQHYAIMAALGNDDAHADRPQVTASRLHEILKSMGGGEVHPAAQDAALIATNRTHVDAAGGAEWTRRARAAARGTVDDTTNAVGVRAHQGVGTGTAAAPALAVTGGGAPRPPWRSAALAGVCAGLALAMVR